MKLQLASDLHLEFLTERFPEVRIIEPAPGADLLVLAGDIANGLDAVTAFADWQVPVLYVAGNHEFYDHVWAQTRAQLREACVGTNVTFLDNDRVDIGGVRFLGSTLWTDFQRKGFTHAQCMDTVERALNDYALIHTEAGILRARDTLLDHQQSRLWLEQVLAQPFDGKTVVISHHGPHPLSIHPRYARDIVSAGYVSDLAVLLAHADLWLHGHVHDSFDYPVGGRCRVVANPAGYVLNRRKAISPARLGFENARFKKTLVLELAT